MCCHVRGQVVSIHPEGALRRSLGSRCRQSGNPPSTGGQAPGVRDQEHN